MSVVNWVGLGVFVVGGIGLIIWALQGKGPQ